MQKGDKVKVYEDPLTEKVVEEEVTLQVYRYSGGIYNDRKIGWWIVKFSDGKKGLRKILEPA